MNPRLLSAAILILVLSACSFNKDLSYEDAYDGHPSEKSASELEKERKEAEEAELFSIEEEYEDDEEEGEELLADNSSNEEAEAPSEDEGLDLYEEDEDALLVGDGEVPAETSEPVVSELEAYKVKKGETLMQIAFKLYGDFTRWRELAKVNSIEGNIISAGSVIQYEPPLDEFIFEPEGEPHLIVYGETLGKISKLKYGQSNYWQSIWNNNRPLIKDPNKIYAGFTLFTQSEEDVKRARGISSL